MNLERLNEVHAILLRENDELTKFITRLVSLREGLRAVCLTFTGVVAGLAFGQDSAVIALFGVPVLLALGIEDGYLRGVYDETLRRQHTLEGILDTYVRYLLEPAPMQTHLGNVFARDAASFSIGFNRNLIAPKFGATLLGLKRRPWIPLIGAVALAGLAVWLLFDSPSAGSDDVRVCIVAPGEPNFDDCP